MGLSASSASPESEDAARTQATERLLGQERAWLEEVFRQQPSAVGIAEAPSGRLVLANDQVATVFRHPAFGADEVGGYAAYRGFHPDGRPYAPEEWPLARALHGAAVQSERITIERGDGTLGVIEVSAGPIRVGEQIVAAVVTFNDVSARVQAEGHQRVLAAVGEALTATLELAASLRAVAAVVVQQIADSCALVVYPTETQPRQFQLLHRDQGVTAQLEQIARAYPPGQESLERLLDALLGNAASHLDNDLTPELIDRLPLRQADQQVVALLAPRSGLLVRLRARGHPVGLLALTRSDPRRPFDDRDRELAEELARRCALAVENARLYADEQRARAEAEHSARLRDEFLAVATHELKTPLAVVLGQAQLMQRRDEREGHLGERDRRTLAMVAEQAQRLNRMISELLDVTRIATGHLELAPAPLDLSAVVRQIVEGLQAMAPRHRIELELPTEPLLLVGDELRLRQAINNLAQNAIKYSPRGGVVIVQLSTAGPTATLRVIDEGIGIPSRDLPRLFERYYRAQNTVASRIEGLGIGLYLVKEIVELHGGSVAVESVEGAGSTFSVALPI